MFRRMVFVLPFVASLYSGRIALAQQASINVATSLATVQLKTNKRTYAAGDTVVVEFSGMPGNMRDWIALTIADSSDSQWGGHWFYTNGQRQGKLKFAGVAPGVYEARAYINWDLSNDERLVVRARQRFTVNDFCAEGKKTNAVVDWRTLKWTHVASNTAMVNQAPAAKALHALVKAMESEGLTAGTLVGTALATLRPDKLSSVIKDPRAMANAIMEQLETKVHMLAPASAQATLGVLAGNAQTLAAALVTVQLLDITVRRMINDQIGVRLFVEVSYAECVDPAFGPPREEKRKVVVDFGPIELANSEALTALTFASVVIEPLEVLGPVQNAISELETIAKNPVELRKAGLTPADIASRVRALRQDAAKLQGARRAFEQRYAAKVGGMAVMGQNTRRID